MDEKEVELHCRQKAAEVTGLKGRPTHRRGEISGEQRFTHYIADNELYNRLSYLLPVLSKEHPDNEGMFSSTCISFILRWARSCVVLLLWYHS